MPILQVRTPRPGAGQNGSRVTRLGGRRARIRTKNFGCGSPQKVGWGSVKNRLKLPGAQNRGTKDLTCLEHISRKGQLSFELIAVCVCVCVLQNPYLNKML